jgi:tetratricopeptide (TPR) repeat protein
MTTDANHGRAATRPTVARACRGGALLGHGLMVAFASWAAAPCAPAQSPAPAEFDARALGERPAQDQPDPAAARASYDLHFAAGLAEVRAGAFRQALLDFRECARLSLALAAEQRAAAAFAADLLEGETILRAGWVPDRDLESRFLRIRAQAEASSAWSVPECAEWRLRCLARLWRSTPARRFVRLLGDADRDWLLRCDQAPDGPAGPVWLRLAGRVLRLACAAGRAEELAALNELLAQEDRLAGRMAAGEVVDAETIEWREAGLRTLVAYFLARDLEARAERHAGHLSTAGAARVRTLLLLRRGDLAAAGREALDLAAARDPAGRPLLAAVLERMGLFEEALVEYSRVLDDTEDPGTRAAASIGRGSCLVALGRHPDAEEAYASALATCAGDNAGLEAERAEALLGLGGLVERRGQAMEAFACYRDAVAVADAARAAPVSDPFSLLSARGHGDSRACIDGMLRVANGAGANLWELAAAMDLLRGRSWFDAAQLGPDPVDGEPLCTALVQRMQASDAEELSAVRADLEVLQARRTMLPRAVRLPTADDLRALASRDRGFTMLVFWVGSAESWLLAANGDDVRLLRLADAASCLRLAALAAAAVAAPDGDPSVLAAAGEAFLPEAVRPMLARRVLIVPDGRIEDLPFEALPGRRLPLGAEHAIVRAPSLAVALVLSLRPAAIGGTVVIDDAGMVPFGGRDWPQTAEASVAEGSRVAAARSRSRLLSGPGASGAALRSALSEPTACLHLSVRAVAWPECPSVPVLLLADGPLPVPGLANRGLAGATVAFSGSPQLLGLGADRAGSGLVEAAFAAGSRFVVGPVRAVHPQATAELMVEMHGWLGRGYDAAAALQLARQALLQVGPYRHPCYWSPFVAFGGARAPLIEGRADAEPVPVKPAHEPSPSDWALRFLILSVLAVLGFFWLVRGCARPKPR